MDNMAFIWCFTLPFGKHQRCHARLHMPEQIHWKTATKRNRSYLKLLHDKVARITTYRFFCCYSIMCSSLFFALSFARTHCVITKTHVHVCIPFFRLILSFFLFLLFILLKKKRSICIPGANKQTVQ